MAITMPHSSNWQRVWPLKEVAQVSPIPGVPMKCQTDLLNHLTFLKIIITR